MVSGTINYKVPDLNVLAIYKQDSKGSKDYTEISGEIPLGNYKINKDKSYCTIGSSKEQNKNISMEYDGHIAIKISQKATKCYVYLDIAEAKKVTVAGLTLDVNLYTPDFSKTACDKGTNSEDHSSGDCTSTDKGIYEAEDDYGTSYYYRGTIDNNWVKFAGYWWRIIRFNGNGSIRLIYSGTVGTGTQPTDGKWVPGDNSQTGAIAYNSKYGDNAYVGYYYGTAGASSYSATHTNATPSTIATYLNGWYESSGLSSQSAKLDGEAGWCNDREKDPNTSGTGAGTSATDYAAYYRLVTNKIPILTCENNSRDLFTLNTDKGKGNGKLTVPIGLMTSDEVIMAGTGYGWGNFGYWLYTGTRYWTMSIHSFTEDGTAWMGIENAGALFGYWGSWPSDVRPVINLKAGTTFVPGGNGTISNPYIVS